MVAAVAAVAITALGQMKEGADAEAAGKFSARQQIRNAKASKAEGARGAIEARRQGDRTASDASAAMVASGGVTDDVGAIKTLSKIKEVSEYNALVSIYKGDQRSQTQMLQAQMDKLAGKNKKESSYIKAAGTAIGGASNAYKMSGT
jgi:hypothetical protein